MLRDEYLRRLVDKAYIDIYLSAHDGTRVYWPWRMEPVHEANRSYRDACESYIVDSSFNRPNITNEDTLDKAHSLDAEIAVLADVYQDKDRTVEAIKEGLDLAESHPFEGKIMVPLQAPHDQCYKEAIDDRVDIVAVGGLKDAKPSTQIAALRSVRDVAGDDMWIHGLGYGISDELVAAVHENPNLLDSVDYSTPVQEALHTDIENGEEYMSVVAVESGARLVRHLRKMSPYIEVESQTQTRLADIQTHG